MNKQFRNSILFIICFFALTNSCFASQAGVVSQTIDNEGYKDYLSRITHSKAFTIAQLKINPTLLKQNENNKITVLGYVIPIDGQNFFSVGQIVNQTFVNKKTPEDDFLTFKTEEFVSFHAFDVYQISGILKNIGSETDPKWQIEAKFAEPQMEQSKSLLSPDYKELLNMTPQVYWSWFDSFRDEQDRLLTFATDSIQIPQPLKDLEGKLIQIEAWLLDKGIKGNDPATGTKYISLHSVIAGQCPCCGFKGSYDYDNTARITTNASYPKKLWGGVFIGKLKLNEPDEWLREGLFTLEDAFLARPNRLPYLPPPPKKMRINPRMILPALKLKPTTSPTTTSGE